MVPPETPAPNEVSDETLHFDYPGSDSIILRSCDSHNFRVPRLYIVNASPVLQKLIVRSVTNTSDVPNSGLQEMLPVVGLPESGETLYSLLTFIFPVTAVLPSTTEKIMELLAVAQKYQMDSVLAHTRAISRQDLPSISPETALHHYFLAQQHGLHEEVLQAARVTLRLSMTLEDLGDKLEFPGTTGAYLQELWKYHERVRTDLKSNLLEFRNTGLPDDVKGLRCTSSRSSSDILPRWLDDYIESIAEAPHLFDLIEFENARESHTGKYANSCRFNGDGYATCSCGGITSRVMRAFWEALTAVVHRTIEKADSTLTLVGERATFEDPDPPSAPLCLNVPDANIILRSSDKVNFRVHESLLAMSSPFFEDLLSLPQPPDDELVDNLPVVHLSEDADLLNSLVSLLYPIPTVIPGSYEKVFALLAACQKYDMVSIQSNIRAEVNRGTFPAPIVAEAFGAFAIASNMGLISEMESAARLTLGYPMTFESLGEILRLFRGRTLCDLVRYRKHCRDGVVSFLDSFLDVRSRHQIWAGCSEEWELNLPYGSSMRERTWDAQAPAIWLRSFFSGKSVELQKGFAHAISSPSTILEEYLAALKNHKHCDACFRVHVVKGTTFCRELENEMAQALDNIVLSSNLSDFKV